MQSEIFENRVYAKRQADSWEAAVELAGSVWLSEGDCDRSYIELIKTQLTQNNAYAVILPGLVLLHAEAGCGVNRNTLMLITLEQPVEFGHPDNDPVEVMICFTSIGKTEHINSMKRIANMLLDDDFMAKVTAADTDDELMSAVCELERGSRKETE